MKFLGEEKGIKFAFFAFQGPDMTFWVKQNFGVPSTGLEMYPKHKG